MNRLRSADAMKVVLCGPPRSGKSCLRQGLKDAVNRIPGAPYCYVITACPDGEGAWFQEAMSVDPDRSRELKAAYKGKFTEQFVARVSSNVSVCSEPLTLVDIGGVPDEKNERICHGATHAVILAGDPARFAEWRSFCDRAGLKVIAEIQSDYDADGDVVRWTEEGLLVGAVHHLERGESVDSRPMVKALAELLVRMVGQSRPIDSAVSGNAN